MKTEDKARQEERMRKDVKAEKKQKRSHTLSDVHKELPVRALTISPASPNRTTCSASRARRKSR